MRQRLAQLLTRMANRLDPIPPRQIEELRRKYARLESAHAGLVLATVEAEQNTRFDVAPEWTPEDASALRNFLSTSTGDCLSRRFQAVAINQAVTGCADVMHTAHSAGAAFGWQEAAKWFQSLSRVARVPVTKTNDEQAPEGEEQLLERLSP